MEDTGETEEAKAEWVQREVVQVADDSGFRNQGCSCSAAEVLSLGVY